MDDMHWRRRNYIINSEYMDISTLQIVDNDFYELNESLNEVYKVNSLESIGWQDPFPKDNP